MCTCVTPGGLHNNFTDIFLTKFCSQIWSGQDTWRLFTRCCWHFSKFYISLPSIQGVSLILYSSTLQFFFTFTFFLPSTRDMKATKTKNCLFWKRISSSSFTFSSIWHCNPSVQGTNKENNFLNCLTHNQRNKLLAHFIRHSVSSLSLSLSLSLSFELSKRNI